MTTKSSNDGWAFNSPLRQALTGVPSTPSGNGETSRRNASAGGSNGRRAPQLTDDRRRRLESLLDGLTSGKGIRHAVMGVRSLDGSFDWAGARGSADADGTPMRTDTPYYVASIDKMFTSAVTLKLWERGELDLDASIGEYLDAPIVTGLHRLGGYDRSAEITVRHLLSHTSGLASYVEDRPKGGRSLFETMVAEGDRAWAIDDVARSVRDGLKPHFEPQPQSAGKQRVRYCDTNFALLHAIIESVTGRPLHEVFEIELFEPLGLADTWMAGRPRAGTRPLERATLWAGDRTLEIPLGMRSMGALYSTLDDQHRFLAGLVSGQVFAQPATFALMTGRWNRFGLPRDAATLRAPSWPIQYGLGIKRFQVPRFHTGGKTMPELFGHSGSTGTWLFYSPELGVTVAGALDQAMAGAVPYRFLPRVMAALA